MKWMRDNSLNLGFKGPYWPISILWDSVDSAHSMAWIQSVGKVVKLSSPSGTHVLNIHFFQRRSFSSHSIMELSHIVTSYLISSPTSKINLPGEVMVFLLSNSVANMKKVGVNWQLCEIPVSLSGELSKLVHVPWRKVESLHSKARNVSLIWWKILKDERFLDLQ